LTWPWSCEPSGVHWGSRASVESLSLEQCDHIDPGGLSAKTAPGDTSPQKMPAGAYAVSAPPVDAGVDPLLHACGKGQTLPRHSLIAPHPAFRHPLRVPATRRGREREPPRRRRRNRPPETLRQKDRGGIRDLWKADGRASVRRTDEVRGVPGRPQSFRFRDRGGSQDRHRLPAGDPCGANQ
jgi:hypothetical protein